MRRQHRGNMNNKIYIGGKWVKSHSQESIAVFNPTTGEIIAKVPNGNKADVDLAVDEAYRAFPNWAAKTPSERAELLDRVAELLSKKK